MKKNKIIKTKAILNGIWGLFSSLVLILVILNIMVLFFLFFPLYLNQLEIMRTTPIPPDYNSLEIWLRTTLISLSPLITLCSFLGIYISLGFKIWKYVKRVLFTSKKKDEALGG